VRSQWYGTRVHSKSTRKWKATFQNLEQEEDDEFLLDQKSEENSLRKIYSYSMGNFSINVYVFMFINTKVIGKSEERSTATE
jgi:hypothetical protein